MKKYFNQLKTEIDSLTVFSQIKNDKAIMQLRELLALICDKDMENAVRVYSDFAASLYQTTSSLTDYIRTLVVQDDNFYVKRTAAGDAVEAEIRSAAEQELIILQKLASLSCEPVQEAIGYEGFLPQWTTQAADLQYDFMEKLNNIQRTGYGIYAKYTFFRTEEGNIIPVAHPDYQRLDELFGYERERGLIMKNTHITFSSGSSKRI